MQTSERANLTESGPILLTWSAVFAGSLVAAALILVLVTFGSALGLSVASTAPTWRDTSSALVLVSGLYLVLAALVSFGFGGYAAGRLRSTWNPGAHDDEFVDFRDGTHGLVSWALAVLLSGIAAAILASAVASREVPAAPSVRSSAGEALIAYDLDRLFRSDRRPQAADLTYARAEASRILLKATSREGMSQDDRSYMVRRTAEVTGIAMPDAERRVNDAVTAATTAVKKARQSAVIVGFSIAVSLLLGAAAAWYAACVGGQHRDQPTPPLRWDMSRTSRPV